MQNTVKLLITGAAGTVGTALLKELCQGATDFDINVFDIDSKHTRRRFKAFGSKINVFYGDIGTPGAIDAACRERDTVIHLAAIIPPLADDNPELARHVNLQGTKNLVQALESNAPEAFLIYASSVSVYGDRLASPDIRVSDPLKTSEGDMYAATKIMAEEHIRNSKLDWSIFRLTAIMGINNHRISKLMFHMPLNTPMEIATPEDTGRAFAEAVRHRTELSKRTFNLSGGKCCRIYYNDFLARSFRIFGLGKLNFPHFAFADRNFHCAYFADADELENILHFRRDNIENYFEKVRRSVSSAQRNITKIFSHIIKIRLSKQSEPLQAVRSHNRRLLLRFFGKENPAEN